MLVLGNDGIVADNQNSLAMVDSTNWKLLAMVDKADKTT